MKKTRILLILIGLFAPLASSISMADIDGGGYGYRRGQNDINPRTLAARRKFDEIMVRQVAQSRQHYGLPHVHYSHDYRMVAQRGRGAETAYAVLPGEVDAIFHFISDARHAHDQTVRQLIPSPRLRPYTREEIENAVTELANLHTLFLTYWGYGPMSEKTPIYERDIKRLDYQAKWNERMSRYEPYSQADIRARIIAGVIEGIRRSELPWWHFWR